MDEKDLYPITDYWYEVTDEQIREHLARPLVARLQLLDEARRFCIVGRKAMIAAAREHVATGAQVSEYDYSYELTDEQLLYYSSLPTIAKLRWLDEARRFTILMRGVRRTYYRDGKPFATEGDAVNESER